MGAIMNSFDLLSKTVQALCACGPQRLLAPHAHGLMLSYSHASQELLSCWAKWRRATFSRTFGSQLHAILLPLKQGCETLVLHHWIGSRSQTVPYLLQSCICRRCTERLGAAVPASQLTGAQLAPFASTSAACLPPCMVDRLLCYACQPSAA